MSLFHSRTFVWNNDTTLKLFDSNFRTNQLTLLFPSLAARGARMRFKAG